MPLRLPPLSSLRLFEAAGRHMSFRRAAEELNLTPSAVSHGIVALEEALGVALFRRSPRKLSLTPEGADYLSYVSEALSLIAVGTQRLPGRGQRNIAVSCAPTFAARCLLPRLGRFQARWPAVSLTIDTNHRHVGFPTDGFDFAIRMGRAPQAGPGWQRLFGEDLVPVRSPAYPVKDLAKATLIHVTTVSEDWAAWAEAAGVDGLDFEGGLRFDTIQLAIEAAQAGLGVALGRRPLIDPDLAAGRLVEAAPQTVEAETAYWLVCSEAVEHRTDLLAFKRWLLAECTGSVAMAE